MQSAAKLDLGDFSKAVPAVLTMILMPLSGSVAWFGGVEAAAQGHNVLKIVLLALVALHLVGALYHQFVLRDGTLARMRRAQG